jgi:hypothetical protein
VILCHDRLGRKLPRRRRRWRRWWRWLRRRVRQRLRRFNEVFDLKQKAFSHARAVFSHCRHPSLDKFV